MICSGGSSGWLKRSIVYLLTIFSICLICPSAHAKYSGGTGEPNDPYKIASAADLIALGNEPNDYDKHFILTVNIDLAGYVFDKAVIAPDTDPNTEWDFEGMPFIGVFDGNGHTISHLTINYGGYLGLFGYLAAGAEVRNLGVVNVNIAGSSGYIGSLTGYNSGTLTRCYCTGTVSGGGYVGGLVGFNSLGVIADCYSNSVAIGSWCIGGLVGYIYGGSVSRCYSTNVVRGQSQVGGLAGFSYSTVTQCYSKSTVSGGSYVGGLVGYNDGGTVIWCYSTGMVGGELFYVGGLVGYNSAGEISQCYSTGWVSGYWWYSGGLVGVSDGAINDSFWDTQTSERIDSAGGTGQTTAEMTDPNTFQAAGWDFVGQSDGPSNLWAQSKSGGYPILWWQLSPLPELPAFSGGTGQPDDPYLISTVQELNSIGYNPRLMESHFKLIADIDLAGVRFYTIGSALQGYAGVFDGNSCNISNFICDCDEPDNVGLFGYVYSGTIRNLALIGSNVHAEECTNVGALVGCLANGSIINCKSSEGFINGGWYVGGLVGYSYYSTVAQSYSTNVVIGTDYTGGLVGYNDNGAVNQCYSTGLVDGSNYVGGLVGKGSPNAVIGSFWDIQTSGQLTSFGGTGQTTTEMTDPNMFQAAGWDFVGQSDGPGDIWAQSVSDGYPILWWQLSLLPELPAFSGGTGLPDDPYLISTAQELNSIGDNPGLMQSHFKLIADIDLAGVRFYSIGNSFHGYSGLFDGNNYKISNFVYDSNGIDNIGIFGYVHGGVILNFELNDPNVKAGTGNNVGSLVGCLVNGSVINCKSIDGSVSGGLNVGGLVGENFYGTVTRSCSTGIVSGSSSVGGLAGYNNYYGTVTQCCSSGFVTGSSRIGGLVGYNDGAYVTQCYSSGVVDGNSYVGGLVGRNSKEYYGFGTVSQCYSTGAVSGVSDVGGLVGGNWRGAVTQCYSTGTVSGISSVGGLVGINLQEWSDFVTQCFWDIQASGESASQGGIGKTTVQMKTQNTFTSAGWDFAGETINGTKDIWQINEAVDYPRLWWEAGEP
jgi:hypothetical protein